MEQTFLPWFDITKHPRCAWIRPSSIVFRLVLVSFLRCRSCASFRSTCATLVLVVRLRIVPMVSREARPTMEPSPPSTVPPRRASKEAPGRCPRSSGETNNPPYPNETIPRRGRISPPSFRLISSLCLSAILLNGRDVETLLHSPGCSCGPSYVHSEGIAPPWWSFHTTV